jgi:hypothetical protein
MNADGVDTAVARPGNLSANRETVEMIVPSRVGQT